MGSAHSNRNDSYDDDNRCLVYPRESPQDRIMGTRLVDELRSLRKPFEVNPKLLQALRKAAETTDRLTITEKEYACYFNGPQVGAFHAWLTGNGLTAGPMESATENHCASREILWGK